MPFNFPTFLALKEFLVVERGNQMQNQVNIDTLLDTLLATHSQALSPPTVHFITHSFNKHLWCPSNVSKTILGIVDTGRQITDSVPEWSLYYNGEDR